jgi:hypothetical protein
MMIVGMAFVGCTKVDPASLFDEDYQPKPAPVISSVSPADGYFAGFEEIVITGSNFTTNTSELFVYFNQRRATILSASPTQIVVRTPNMVADSIGIKVSVLGVEEFSNSWRYKLESLYKDEIQFTQSQKPYAVTVNPVTLDYYVSIEIASEPWRVRRYNSNGEFNLDYFTNGQNWFYRSMKFGPDGSLYLIRGSIIPILYTVGSSGGSVTSFSGGLGRTEDVTFDSNGNAWTVGTNEGISSNARLNRITPSKAVSRYNFDANGYAINYFNSAIYVAGTRNSKAYIWKFELDSDSKPSEELVIAEIPQLNSNDIPTGIVIAADGTVIVSMTGSKNLFQISNSGIVSEMYSGIVPGTPLKMEFIPNSTNVIMTLMPFDSEGKNRVISLNVQKSSPY